MLWWIVDNLFLVLLCLGIIALCCGAAWWTYRNSKVLIGVAVPAALMLLALLLSFFIVTDTMQLVRNIESMRDLINDGKIDEFSEYFEDNITIDTMNGKLPFHKADLKMLASSNMKKYGVKRIFVSQIDVEQISRPNAETSFIIGREDGPERGRCRIGFVLGPDGKWRAKTMTVENVVGGQKAPVLFPF